MCAYTCNFAMYMCVVCIIKKTCWPSNRVYRWINDVNYCHGRHQSTFFCEDQLSISRMSSSCSSCTQHIWIVSRRFRQRGLSHRTGCHPALSTKKSSFVASFSKNSVHCLTSRMQFHAGKPKGPFCCCCNLACGEAMRFARLSPVTMQIRANTIFCFEFSLDIGQCFGRCGRLLPSICHRIL